jgi:hypothetical protein
MESEAELLTKPSILRNNRTIQQKKDTRTHSARGKAAYDHSGNHRFRTLVKLHQQAYAAATTKYHKSQIVSHIINTVRHASPEGGFVKLINGVWHEVGDRAAKEKVGQTFRDNLDRIYSSSTKAKARARIRGRIEDYEASSRSSPPALLRQTMSSPEPADHVSGFGVSIVSPSSDDGEVKHQMTGSSTVDMTIATKPEESLVDTLLNGLNHSLSDDGDDLEPLPLEAAIIQFNDSELSLELDGSFHNDMLEFYYNLRNVLV